MFNRSYFNKPFIHITIPMIMGIVIYYYIDVSIKFILIGLIISLIFFFLYIFKEKKSIYIIYFLLFFVGLFVMYGKTENSTLLSFNGEKVEMKGRIVESNFKEGYSNYIVEINFIYRNNLEQRIKEKILLKTYGEKTYNDGDIIVFNGVLAEPKRNTNPNLFNYKLYLETEDVFVTLSTRSELVKVISKDNLSFSEKLRKNFKYKVESTFDKYLNVHNRDLMKSIMLGNIGYLDENSQVKYRELGLAHLMAISGLHIGIISYFLISLFELLGINRKINIGITICVMWIYGYLIGFPPSVLRSLIMFTVLMYSQVLNRPYDGINTISFAAFILLLLNPLWLFNIGFQLSFAATFSLILLSQKLRDKFYPYQGSVMTSLYGILAVQIGIAPIIAYYYNYFSPISILANFLIIPILSLGVIMGFCLLIFSFMSGTISLFIGYILNGLLYFEYFVSNAIYNLPLGMIKLYSPSIVGIFLYYFIVLCIFKYIKLEYFPKNINKAIFYYLIICILFVSFLPIFKKEVNIEFIDVGQGDSILIEDNGKYFLIDTGGSLFGNFDIGENILLPYLTKRGVFTLDGVFVTHFHEDHCKNLPLLIDNMKVKRIFIGYENRESQLYNEIRESGRKNNVPIYKLKKGQVIYIQDDIYIEVLSPSEEVISKYSQNENNLSLVLLLNSYDKNVLFTGDIEKETEMYLKEQEGSKVYFLKVPHHGSNTSSSEEFIEHFKPEYGFISVGKNNFGHPNEEVLLRFQNRKIPIYRTDKSGLITLTITPRRFNIDTFVKNKYTFSDIILHYGENINFILIYLALSYFIVIKSSYLFEELKIDEI